MTFAVEGHLVRGMPLVEEGDDIASMIGSRAQVLEGDVLCVASTIVAKAEGRLRSLDSYSPSVRAVAISCDLGKDPRFVQAVLEESAEVLIERPFLLVATRFGHICVNAGIDQSNVPSGSILLLPVDPTASARGIRDRLGVDCAVIVTDTCGRPFRCGVSGVAVGWSGIAAIRDWRQGMDLLGRRLEITQESIVDEIAAMANLMMGEGDGGTPAVVFRGLTYPRFGGTLFRPVEMDVMRRYIRGERG